MWKDEVEKQGILCLNHQKSAFNMGIDGYFKRVYSIIGYPSRPCIDLLKNNMFRASAWLMAGLLTCAPLFCAFSQITERYDSGFTYRELNAGVDGSPSTLATQPNTYMYTYHPTAGFNETKFFPLRLPRSYLVRLPGDPGSRPG